MSDLRPTVVIGLGNPLLGDEGVGVKLAQALADGSTRFPQADILELGTCGLSVLHALAGRRQAVLMDCARMRLPPGTIRRFTPDQVVAALAPPVCSLHQNRLLDVLALARSVGPGPPTIVIFGIQPASLEPGAGLSPALTARWDEYLSAIASEIHALCRAQTAGR